MKVHNATGDRKTAEALLKELEDVLTTLQNDWGAIVVGLVTDASGESRKARRLFGVKYPHIIVLDCYSHQVIFYTHQKTHQRLIFLFQGQPCCR